MSLAGVFSTSNFDNTKFCSPLSCRNAQYLILKGCFPFEINFFLYLHCELHWLAYAGGDRIPSFILQTAALPHNNLIDLLVDETSWTMPRIPILVKSMLLKSVHNKLITITVKPGDGKPLDSKLLTLVNFLPLTNSFIT